MKFNDLKETEVSNKNIERALCDSNINLKEWEITLYLKDSNTIVLKYPINNKTLQRNFYIDSKKLKKI